MNKSITYLAFGLALVYQAIIFRPLLSVVEYQVNKDFIQNNLCVKKDVPTSNCAGKCYLKKELDKVTQSESSNSEGSSKNSQTNEDDVLHIGLCEKEFEYSKNGKITSSNNSYCFSISGFSKSPDSPPPKA